MAKIIRTIKFWSETTGQSHHIGIEVDTTDDLHITIREGHEVEDMTAAIKIAGQILMASVSKKEVIEE